jgi:hypothetical protein
MLGDTNFHPFALVVPHSDLESFVDGSAGVVDLKIGAAALANHIERRAGVDLDCLVFGRMADFVLTGKL